MDEKKECKKITAVLDRENSGLMINWGCIPGFTSYVTIEVNPINRMLMLKPSSSFENHAIRCNNEGDKRFVGVSAKSAFFDVIYKMMGWNKSCYTVEGNLGICESGKAICFNLDTARIGDVHNG